MTTINQAIAAMNDPAGCTVFAAREVARRFRQNPSSEELAVYLEALCEAVAKMQEDEYDCYLADMETILNRDLTDDEANRATFSHDHGRTVVQAIAALGKS